MQCPFPRFFNLEYMIILVEHIIYVNIFNEFVVVIFKELINNLET